MKPIKTGVVMLNMGGPSSLRDVNPFLRRLFGDNEIIDLGRLQSTLGPFIADRRTSKIQGQYGDIGGGSPIGHWTDVQGRKLAQQLDQLSPSTAPHKAYTAFRYADPLTEMALEQMREDGVSRAVAFSQYPQFSCTTSGSSLNQLWRELDRLNMNKQFQWSVIDRWPTHPGYIHSVADCVKRGLDMVPEGSARDGAVIVFSSHSLPQKIITRGDPYAQEMGATVQLVMARLAHSHSYVHAWQSKIGFLPWVGPNTSSIIDGLAKSGHRHVVVVPIGFTSDHVETLYELDIQYADAARKSGIVTYARAPSLNDSPIFVDALSDIVHRHLSTQELCSTQYNLNCAHCTNPTCRTIVNPIKPHSNLRARAQSIL